MTKLFLTDPISSDFYVIGIGKLELTRAKPLYYRTQKLSVTEDCERVEARRAICFRIPEIVVSGHLL